MLTNTKMNAHFTKYSSAFWFFLSVVQQVLHILAEEHGVCIIYTFRAESRTTHAF